MKTFIILCLMGTKNFKPKQIRLKIPEDVYRYILKEQARQKLKCNCQFSIESTIYMIIRKEK